MPAIWWLITGAVGGFGVSYIASDTVKTAVKWSALGAGAYLIAKQVKK